MRATISPDFWDRFFAGDRKACAKLITRVENDPSSLADVAQHFTGKLGRAVRVGITGPPGVGKSTLASAIAFGMAERGHRVGIVAVDPSSPFTGGAFMGDRVRMDRLVGDTRVFMRSMASRDGRGGLSPATPRVADVLEAFGMDRILIETVGVGQAELDVLQCVDLVMLALQPATGDAIQSLKAGIIEIADLVVVNKSDLPGALTLIQSLRFSYSFGGANKTTPPILATSAQQNKGIAEVVDELERMCDHMLESGDIRKKRIGRMVEEIKSGIKEALWEQYVQSHGHVSGIEEEAARLAESGGSPYAYIRKACAGINLKTCGTGD